MVLKHESRADAKRPSDERQLSSHNEKDDEKDELRERVLVLEHKLDEKKREIQQLMHRYQSQRILFKVTKEGVKSVLDDASLLKVTEKGVKAVLDDASDLASLLLLDYADPARLAVLEAVRDWKEEKARKQAEQERKEERERKRQRQSYAMETRPEHVAIGKGATMVHWVVTSGE